MDPQSNNSTYVPYSAPQKKSKKGLIVLIVVALLVIIACILYWLEVFETDSQNPTASGEITVIADRVIPKEFPAGFPLIEKGELLENYEYKTEDNIQHTRKYMSYEDPVSYYTRVKKFFIENNWGYDELGKINDSFYGFSGQDNVGKKVNVNMNKVEENKWIIEISFINLKILKYEPAPSTPNTP